MDENENGNRNGVTAEVEVEFIPLEAVIADCDSKRKRGSYVVNPDGETALEPEPGPELELEPEPRARCCGARAWTIAIAVLFMSCSSLQLTFGIMKFVWWDDGDISHNSNGNPYYNNHHDYSYGFPKEVEKLLNKCIPSALVIIVSAGLELVFSLLLLIGTLTKSPLALSVWLLTMGLTILGVATLSIFATFMIYEHVSHLFLAIFLIGSLLICVILTLCYLIVYFHRNELFASAQKKILMSIKTLDEICGGKINSENVETYENLPQDSQRK